MSKYILLAAAVAASGLIATATIYKQRADNLEGRLMVAMKRLAEAESASRLNQTSFEQCQKVNQQNASEAARQSDRARRAEIRLVEATGRVERRVDEITREAETLRVADKACPAIDDTFRQWMRDD